MNHRNFQAGSKLCQAQDKEEAKNMLVIYLFSFIYKLLADYSMSGCLEQTDNCFIVVFCPKLYFCDIWLMFCLILLILECKCKIDNNFPYCPVGMVKFCNNSNALCGASLCSNNPHQES